MQITGAETGSCAQRHSTAMPRKPKVKRAKKTSGKRKAEWYDSPEEGDDVSSDVSSSASPEPSDWKDLCKARKLSVVNEQHFADTQTKSPFDALLNSLLTSTESLPIEARQGIFKIKSLSGTKLPGLSLKRLTR